MKNKSRKIHMELFNLRDNLIGAIRDQRTGALENLLDVYRALVEAFVKKLKQLGADYDMATTLKEANSFRGGWDEMRWLEDDIRAMIDGAFKTSNPTILRDVAYFPVSIAHIALLEKDYYTYRQSLRWIPYCVMQASSIDDAGVKEGIIDRIIMYIQETADYYVGYLMQESRDAVEVGRLKEFAAGLVLALNDLLKSLHDRNDIDNFRKFLACLDNLFKDTFQHITDYSIESQELTIAHGTLSPSETEELKERLGIDRALYEAGQYINTLRDQLRYGMQGWVVEEYRSGEVTQVNQKKAVEFYKELGNYGDIKKLTNLYFDCMDRDIERLFGWDWWMLGDTKGEVKSFNVNRQHSNLYCLKAMELLRGVTNEQMRNYEIPERRDLVFLVENESSELLSILSEIEQARSRWEPLTNPMVLDASSVLRDLLRRAVERQKEKELSALIHADIDLESLVRFKSNLIKRWKEHATMRWIIRTLGRYEEAGLAPKDNFLYGFNIADRKDVYVKDAGIFSRDWGKHYGDNLGHQEDELVCKEIFRLISPLDTGDIVVPRERQFELVDKALGALRGSGYAPNAILLFNAWSLRVLMMEAKGRWKLPKEAGPFVGEKMIGYYDDVAVYEVHKRGERGIAVVADLKRLGLWKQYEPRQLIPDEEERLEVFTFLLRQYDQVKAEELLMKNPEWLKDPQTQEPRTREQALQAIFQRVHLRVFEQYEYVVEDPKAAAKIIMGKDW